jgi:hypothetical protein
LDEIDSLPASEYIAHKAFWEKYLWGIQEDLLAGILAQTVSARTGSKPLNELWGWKLSVVRSSAPMVKRISTGLSATKRIAQGFMSLARALGKKKDGISS